jgi:hypothetical protein
MKRIGEVILELMFGLTLSVTAASRPVHPRRNRTVRPQRVHPNSYPKIRSAIAALEAAKSELTAARGDFGGHKSDAIAAVDNALKRLRLALQFEKY